MTKMNYLNQKYKRKFGFPFIICARLNQKDAIFDAIECRCNNDSNNELKNGIEEVLLICELRVRDIIYNNPFSKL